MVFSSYIFLFVFLPTALLLYYIAPYRARHLLLTLLSYLFYGWANPLFMVLMLISTLVDYVAGLVIAGGRTDAQVEGGPRSRRQRMALLFSIISNLSLLGFFKYFNFGVDSINAFAMSLGVDHAPLDVALRVTLPLGISFYTFQSMSYTIDVYRGHGRAMRNFIDFACYLSMFPQLVAGPIIRFSEVSEQLRHRTHTLEKFARGVSFFALGLTKKILFANPCGKIADTVFGAAGVSTLDAWYGMLAYAFQIYFDFSGYSDMAIGLGLMLGFVFTKNFDSPYRAESITEFWRRWHISLSSWLRDYLYIPLGGNRHGSVRTAINLALVMLLGGLWHGAAWTFVMWGGLHGLLLGLERLGGRTSLLKSMPRPMRVLVTFILVSWAWVFFRSPDLTAACNYFACLFGAGPTMPESLLVRGLLYKPYYLLSFVLAAVVIWTMPQTWDWTRTITPIKAAITTLLMILSVIVMLSQAFNPFIYFIF